MLNPKFDTCFFERYAMVSLASLHLNGEREQLQGEVGNKATSLHIALAILTVGLRHHAIDIQHLFG